MLCHLHKARLRYRALSLGLDEEGGFSVLYDMRQVGARLLRQEPVRGVHIRRPAAGDDREPGRGRRAARVERRSISMGDSPRIAPGRRGRSPRCSTAIGGHAAYNRMARFMDTSVKDGTVIRVY